MPNLDLVARVVKSWRTSAVGVTGSAVAIYLFQTLGCRWPDSSEWVAVILPAVVGLVTKEQAHA